MADVRLTVEEYLDLLEQIKNSSKVSEKSRRIASEILETKNKPKAKRKSSTYNRKYKAAFKKVKSSYMTKSGKWKKGGFQKAVKAAHKEAKK